MKNITIHPTVEAYEADFMERAFPDERIADNEFYRRLIGWVIDNRTPMLYNQTHPDEYANMSINFNWLLDRDYDDTKLGPPDTIKSLYSLHECTHMTNWLPQRLGEIAAGEYADQFTRSEYRASNESEILAHYRIPDLRQTAFQGMKLAVDIMRQRQIPQPSSALLGKVRATLIEHDDFDHLFAGDPEVQQQVDRLQQFNGNRAWAGGHYNLIRQRFSDSSLPLGGGLTDTEYESVIANYQPQHDQARYEANLTTNIRLAYGMCGLPIPPSINFNDATEAAKELEGRHALVIN